MTASSKFPGLLIALAVAVGAWVVVQLVALLPPPAGSLPLSMILVAIVAGLTLAGPASRRSSWSPGLDLARRRLLKFAVALVGLRLSLIELADLGWQALPLVILAVLGGLMVTFVMMRLFGVDTRLSVLLTAGTSICGASAVAATAPGIGANHDETAYAVVCVLLVGLAATVLYPLLLPLWFDDPTDIGLIMGAAIHDTSQVVAAATLHEQLWSQDGTLVAATVTKLLRNASMLIVIPALVWVTVRHGPDGATGMPVPLFIVGFITLSAARTAGDGLFGADHPLWQGLVETSTTLSLFVFAMAMASMAMAVRPTALRRLGWRPAAAAIIAAAALLALAVIWLL